jgi:hypothetical protein
MLLCPPRFRLHLPPFHPSPFPPLPQVDARAEALFNSLMGACQQDRERRVPKRKAPLGISNGGRWEHELLAKQAAKEAEEGGSGGMEGGMEGAAQPAPPVSLSSPSPLPFPTVVAPLAHATPQHTAGRSPKQPGPSPVSRAPASRPSLPSPSVSHPPTPPGRGMKRPHGRAGGRGGVAPESGAAPAVATRAAAATAAGAVGRRLPHPARPVRVLVQSRFRIRIPFRNRIPFRFPVQRLFRARFRSLPTALATRGWLATRAASGGVWGG